MKEDNDMFADQIATETVLAESSAAIMTPASWFVGLSPEKKLLVRHVSTDALILHPSCELQPTLASAAEAVDASVGQHGVLTPLAVSADGTVLDGRYRLWSAKKRDIASLPVLTIDVSGDDAYRWVYEVKNAREHLSENERAFLAHQYQQWLKVENVKLRTKKMNDARLSKTSEVRHSSSPKLDSWASAAAKYKVPVRKINQVAKIAKENPDLLESVVKGQISATDALKKQGKLRNAERAEVAKASFLREEDVKDGEMENRIHQGDAESVLKQIAAATASLVMCSPVYHGAKVDYLPALPSQTYQNWKNEQSGVLNEAFRVSRSGGRLVIVIDTTKNPVRDGDEMLPLFADFVELARKAGWKFWMDIAWFKPEVCGSKTTYGSFAKCSAPGWGRDHEWILIFFKDQKKLEGDPNLTDLEREEHKEWWRTTWKIQCETRRSILDHHCAPFPEELVTRLIKMLTYRRDLVIDPFNGSGTTTAVAKRLGRRYIGIDQSPNYCDFARDRTLREAVVSDAEATAA